MDKTQFHTVYLLYDSALLPRFSAEQAQTLAVLTKTQMRLAMQM